MPECLRDKGAAKISAFFPKFKPNGLHSGRTLDQEPA